MANCKFLSISCGFAIQSLLKSPFLLARLMLRPTMATLLDDDVGASVAPPDATNMGAFPRRTSARSPGVAAPATGPPAHPAAAVATREGRPVALGAARAPLGWMANGAGDRQAGDRHRLASARFPPVVGLEKSAPPRATDGARGRPLAHSHDGAGEPALGRAAFMANC